MKIVGSLSKLYFDQRQLAELVKKRVDEIFNVIKRSEWHYVSRIKQEESFAQKIETGRFHHPSQLEDFLGCTLVVDKYSCIKDVRKLLKTHIVINYERPRNIKRTSKSSDSFRFDDLRLYAQLRPTSAREKGPMNEMIFEIQIKTFLQHAWSIATHDLIYKADSISWIRQRVAFQVKAMLESAEVSIELASGINKLPGLPETSDEVERQCAVREFLIDTWPQEMLPSDLLTLTKKLDAFMNVVQMRLGELRTIMETETNAGRGVQLLNLSPYLAILQSIILQSPDTIKKYIDCVENNSRLPRLFLPREIDMGTLSDLPITHLVRT